MQRVDAPEILDSEDCPADQIAATLQTLDRINRWFGGVATTQKMVERVAVVSGKKHFSLLEAAAGSGKLPQMVRQRLAPHGITLDVTLLDRLFRHLPGNHLPGNITLDVTLLDRLFRHLPGNHLPGNHRGPEDGENHTPQPKNIVADALRLPFRDGVFDLVSCNLFAHHLNSDQLSQFVREALRVSRWAVLINDLVRHPMHLGLVYASYPIMGSRVAWLDGLTSVRRAYLPQEMRNMIASAFLQGSAPRTEIMRQYLFRMGVIVWKS